MDCTVVICTHNPREDYLRRVLEGLRRQTLPFDRWELLVIDNASSAPLAGRFDLSWQPHGRHIREDELGLTPARLRGIRESRAAILIFADDDTVLAPDYLAQALAVGESWPHVGVWGGSAVPEFETPPPDWCRQESWRLTILTVKEDVWSNVRDGTTTIPVGAGMCLRRKVGENFVERCRAESRSKALGRKGSGLSGYEDVDLAYCAIDLGLGTGKSTRLSLTHLIPASRLTLDYFLRHAEGDAASLMMFRAIRGLPVPEPPASFLSGLKWFLRRRLSREPVEILKIREAERKGKQRGWKLVQDYLAATKSPDRG